MNKKRTALVIVIVVVCFLLIMISEAENIAFTVQHPSDFFGNYYKLDDLRCYIDKEKKKSEGSTIYENYKYLFSEDFDDVIVDFVINDNSVVITKIKCSKSGSGRRFRRLSTSVYENSTLDFMIKKSENDHEIHWTKVISMPGFGSNKDSTQLQWSVISERSGLQIENCRSIKFDYNGEPCYILLEKTNES